MDKKIIKNTKFYIFNNMDQLTLNYSDLICDFEFEVSVYTSIKYLKEEM